jgi:pilus assembly protein CpaC
MTMASEMKKKQGRSVMKSAITMLMAACVTLQPGIALSPALATDLNQPITDQEPVSAGSNFVRLGLNKSFVVRLPAEARDVIVGNPNIIDAVVRRKDVAYIFAREIGQSNIFFFGADGQEILSLDIEVAVDGLALKKLINRTFPGNRITVDTVNSNVVLGGMARSTLEAKMAMQLASKFVSGGAAGSGGESSTAVAVMDTMKVAGDDQVMLKVKIVEIQRNALKQLGVDLQAAIAAGQNVFNIASINPFSLSNLTNSSDGGIQFSDNQGTNRFNTILRAMEEDGLSRVLAEPNLTALNGQKADFWAGGEIPFTTCNTSADSRDCTVSFKPYGVNLNFTPTVLDENRIQLNLATEISEISNAVAGVPSLDTRKTQSTVELPSGGAMMIAGLIKETTRQNMNGFPGLKKLPVLGALFRSREFQSNETELVIIITPYLVNPVAQHRLKSPDKNFNPATERQSLFFGKLHKNFNTKGKAPAGKYNGSVGFIVE